VGQASVPAHIEIPRMREDELAIYRRRLPHWRMGGATYFITWRLHPAQPDLEPDEREVVVAALKHFDDKRYELLAYVVMHNHVHVLLKPLVGHRLQDIMHSWKSYTASSLQKIYHRQNRIWQDEYFDRIIRNDEEFWEKVQYILNNPFKTWPEITEYRWLSIKMVAGTEARPTITEAFPTGTEELP